MGAGVVAIIASGLLFFMAIANSLNYQGTGGNTWLWPLFFVALFGGLTLAVCGMFLGRKAKKNMSEGEVVEDKK